jgi:hypothetical protein
MTIVLFILAVAVIIYLYAAIAFYYGFRNWIPFCGCGRAACFPRKPASR